MTDLRNNRKSRSGTPVLVARTKVRFLDSRSTELGPNRDVCRLRIQIRHRRNRIKVKGVITTARA